MERLIFANQIRGVAAMSVVFSHLVGVFWGMRDFVGLASASPVQVGPPPDVFVLVSHPWFNFGPFGVGLFFLISGLVIPFSLERHSRGTFLAARALRIYPTYVAALLIEMAVLRAGALYWQQPFPYDAWTIAANLLLLHLLSGYPSVDLVNWTLGVELKFYLIMCAIAPLVLRGRVGALFAVAALLVLANAALGLTHPAVSMHPDVARQLSIDLLFLVFMLIGALFHCHLRGHLSTAGLTGGVAAMLALFLISWRTGLVPEQFPAVTVNYLYALGVFASAYAARRHARPAALLDFFASISYPLYLVHSIVGYSILKVLMITGGLSYGAALPATLAAVIALATVLHHAIERPSIALGRRLARLRRHGAATAPAATPAS